MFVLRHFLLFIGVVLSLEVFAQQVEAERTALGKVRDSRLNELSGLIASRKHEGMFWTHNDSGDSARFFLIDQQAELKGVYRLEGIDASDIEDIARYSFQGKHFLVLADIGDNRAVRTEIRLYVLEEPEWVAGVEHYDIPRTQIETITLTYSDKPRDAEAIFVDPTDLTAYIVSKRDFYAGIYPVSLKEGIASEAALVIRKAIDLPITFVTSADISLDGQYILMKNLTQVYRWKRTNGASITHTLSTEFIKIPYTVEPQGEAICFGEENHVFYTVSERPLGLEAYLYSYRIQGL